MLHVSRWTWLVLLLGVSTSGWAVAPPAPPVHTAISMALPLLVKGGRGHMQERQCFACHNQGPPIVALTLARKRGFPVRGEDIHDQLDYIATHLARVLDNFRKGTGSDVSGNQAGYALAALESGGWKADALTADLVEHLLARDKDRSHWASISLRPPTSGSDFTDTCVALHGLRVWGTPAQKERIDRRIATVRGWLLATKAKDTEDRVFRLGALHEAGVKGKALSEAVMDLLHTQHDDGGWGQLDGMKSDAYATATALVALHQAGGIATTDKVYQRGVAWLLKAQLADGSWLVHTRSKPIQKYYESGFPHGKDQFISMSATGWVVTALALTLPEPKPTALGER
jgi:hypothetical protein